MADANQLPKDKGQAENSPRSLSGYLQSQLEGLQQCLAAQIVPAPHRSVEKLHEFLPDHEKISAASQNFKVTQYMESIYTKEKIDAFNSIMEENQPSTTQSSSKNSPNSQQQKFQYEKEATSSEQGKRKGTSHKTIHPGLQNSKDSAGCHGKCVSDGQNYDEITEKGGSQIKISEIVCDILNGLPNLYIATNVVKSHISDKNSSICNSIKTNNLGLSQIIETLMCFGQVLRKIKTSNNGSSFCNKINEQSSIIKELTDKYSKFNIDDLIETRIEQAINIIKADNKKVLDEIPNLFTEVKTATIAFKKCFDISQ
ncbi:hypothetical protein O181_101166 [Austropuccinia psidii MF-1]|uniref:Uncharacterized protein n=1 Tax=Austropuccinia psidii MF-1 TaxID=1389203 RepID=A0A9Q3JGM2_9BASI|nr:hypothetical protein [Austropuccinia psidii MF-1]